MIQKLARNTLNYVVGSPLHCKAIAFAILVKDKNRTSTFKDWSYRDIARCAGVSPNTAKRYIEILRSLHLVRREYHNGHHYLVFKKIRRPKIRNKKNTLYHTPRTADIALSKLDRSGVNTIAKGLRALDIENTQRRKDYIKRLIKLKTNPSPFDPGNAIKRARAICRKRGWEVFTDKGYSYKGLARRFHCSPNTVKEIIALGEGLELFWAERKELVLVKYVGKGRAKDALPYFKDEFPNAFATKNNIYYQPALVFHLWEG